jgi:hypothetical protein
VFDFRYHALSLAAVLIALFVGLLIGVAIGDAGLVSSAERNVRADLRSDIGAANRRADELRATLGQELADAKRFEDAAYPRLVGGQLRGRRIGLVFLGRPSDEIASQVREALNPTGGQIVLRAVIREPLDLSGLAGAARGTRYSALGKDPRLVEAFGFRMGAQLVAGGKLIGRARGALLRSFNGVLVPLDGVVLVRLAPDLKGDADTARDAFERGLVHGLRASNAPTTGIETTSTEPSQIPWYRDNDVTSVDDVDRVAGHAALVLTLVGGIDGAFGVKSTAEAMLPDVVGG